MATVQCVTDIISLIMDFYQGYGKDGDMERMTGVWTYLLKPYTDAQAKKAVLACIGKSKFAPTPAEVLEQLHIYDNAVALTPAELMAQLEAAIEAIPSDYRYIDCYPEGIRRVLSEQLEQTYEGLDLSLKMFLGGKAQFLRYFETPMSDNDRTRFYREIPNLIKQAQIRKEASDEQALCYISKQNRPVDLLRDG